MYGKLHQTYYDSSIIEEDAVTQLVFIGAIVLSDRHGRLDMTVESLARRINQPLDDVRRSIARLMEPDPRSRSADHDGRRLLPIDEGRDWGWVVVNKESYRTSRDPEEERDQARERKRRQRQREKQRATPDTNTDTYTGVTDGHEESRKGHALSRSDRDMWFEKCWSIVPRKFGKRDARKSFDAQVNTTGDAEEFYQGIQNYNRLAAVEKTEPKFQKHGSALFRNIHDYTGDAVPVRARRQADPASVGTLLRAVNGGRAQ